jgi:hypothetical protein
LGVPFFQSYSRMIQIQCRPLGLSVPNHPVAPGAASDKEAREVELVSHFVLAFRVLFRVCMAETVRFSFRAIKTLSVFESSNAKSCASSSGVHSRPLGRGPVILLSPLV